MAKPNIADAANNMFSMIGAVQTLVENFPMSLLSFVDVKLTSSFEVISVLFQILGIDREEVIELVSNALCGNIKGTSDGGGFISQVEEIVKMALEANIINILNCTTNPIISNKLLDDYTSNKDSEESNGEGVTLSVSEIDIIGSLNRSPFSASGEKFYFDIDELTVNDVYKSKDFNAFLWYVINKSDKTQTDELIWDNRYRAKIYGNNNSNKKEIIKCTYLDDVYPDSDKIKVQICGAREKKPANYFKTRKLTVGNQDIFLNKTILEFNHDFLTSIKLYEPKVIVAEIVEQLFGGLSVGVDLGFSINEEFIRGKVQQIIRNVMLNDDFNVTDCYFSFSNEEYNNMLEASERNRYGVVTNGNGYYEVNTTSILDKLTSITNNSTLQEDKAVISSVLSDIIATPAQDPSAEITGNPYMGLQFDIMQALVFPFIRPLFTPKVIFLLMINKKIMGSLDDAELGNFEPTQMLNDLLNVIIKEIIIRLKDLLLDMFLSYILKKLSPLIALLASRLLLETFKMYLDLLVQILKCIPIFRFGNYNNSNQEMISVIDDVNYADIINNEKKDPGQALC